MRCGHARADVIANDAVVFQNRLSAFFCRRFGHFSFAQIFKVAENVAVMS